MCDSYLHTHVHIHTHTHMYIHKKKIYMEHSCKYICDVATGVHIRDNVTIRYQRVCMCMCVCVHVCVCVCVLRDLLIPTGRGFLGRLLRFNSTEPRRVPSLLGVCTCVYVSMCVCLYVLFMYMCVRMYVCMYAHAVCTCVPIYQLICTKTERDCCTTTLKQESDCTGVSSTRCDEQAWCIDCMSISEIFRRVCFWNI